MIKFENIKNLSKNIESYFQISKNYNVLKIVTRKNLCLLILFFSFIENKTIINCICS